MAVNFAKLPELFAIRKDAKNIDDKCKAQKLVSRTKPLPKYDA